MYDKLGYLQTSTTQIASFTGAGVDLNKGTPLRGLVARVLYSAASNAAGSGTVVFGIQHSDDNVTFVDLAQGTSDKLTLTTAVASGEVFIPFRTDKRWVRLTQTLTGGTTPTITYESQIGLSKP
jgi:hypothetical protein